MTNYRRFTLYLMKILRCLFLGHSWFRNEQKFMDDHPDYIATLRHPVSHCRACGEPNPAYVPETTEYSTVGKDLRHSDPAPISKS